MKKVPTTALAMIALTAFLTAGCASIEEVRDELTSVKDDLADLEASNTSLQSQLTAAGETIDDLKAQVATVTTAPGEPGAYSGLTYEFKHWEPAAGVDGEEQARDNFWKTLRGKFSAWRTERGLLPELKGTTLTVSSTKGIISKKDKNMVEAAIKSLLGTDIAAVQTTEHKSVSVGELISTLVSVSGGVMNDPTCTVDLIYRPVIEGAIAPARIYWHYVLKDKEYMNEGTTGKTEIRVPVGGEKRTATLRGTSHETEVCVPSRKDEKIVYIMVVTEAKETPKAAHYRVLQTRGLEVTKDELVHAPLTIDHPGCPPPSWEEDAGPAKAAGAFFRNIFRNNLERCV